MVGSTYSGTGIVTPEAVRLATRTAAWIPGEHVLPTYLAGSSATRLPSASTVVVEPPMVTSATTVPTFVPGACVSVAPYPAGA